MMLCQDWAAPNPAIVQQPQMALTESSSTHLSKLIYLSWDCCSCCRYCCVAVCQPQSVFLPSDPRALGELDTSGIWDKNL